MSEATLEAYLRQLLESGEWRQPAFGQRRAVT
jgi:hypothetical protein